MDVLLILLLILLNGVLAMSEIAVVSSRRARLHKLADQKLHGAQAALELNHEPSKFLSTIQVGITTVAILSGAIGENTLADPLASWLAGFASLAPYSRGLSLTIVVAGLTYFSVVIGELIPKQLGLLAPERVAAFMAPSMNVLARIARPLVWLFSTSSSLLMAAVGAVRKQEPPVTDDEIKVLMALGAEAGVFHVSERAIVSNVLRLDEQRITTIMTHRNEIYLLDLDAPEETIRQRIADSPYTRVVVCRGGLDNIAGILRITDLLADVVTGKPLKIEKLLRRPLYVPESVSITNLLENYRRANRQAALIVDEYGELLGMVTLADVMIAIVGEIPTSDLDAEQEIVQRKDRSWLVDGSVTIERMKSELGIAEALPGEKKKSFNTLGGFVMYVLDRVPQETDTFEAAGFSFEVVDMDRNHVDKVLVRRLDNQEPPTHPAAQP